MLFRHLVVAYSLGIGICLLLFPLGIRLSVGCFVWVCVGVALPAVWGCFSSVQRWCVLVCFCLLGMANSMVHTVWANKQATALHYLKQQAHIYSDVIFVRYIYSGHQKAGLLFATNHMTSPAGRQYRLPRLTVFMPLSFPPDLVPGERVRWIGFLKDVRQQGVGLQCQVKALGPLVRMPTESTVYNQVFHAVRMWCMRVLADYSSIYGHKGQALLSGVLLGDRRFLGRQTKQTFVNSGIYHIFAISGLHIVIIYTACMLLFRLCRTPYVLALCLSAFFLVFYAVLTGGHIPVVRAVGSVLVYLVALLLGRPRHVIPFRINILQNSPFTKA